MKVAIVVVAYDTEILAFFEKLKGSVVPKELSKGGRQFNTLAVNAACSDDVLCEILVAAHQKHDAVGVLFEEGMNGRLSSCSSAIFLKAFDPTEAKPSMKNYFGHNLNRWLKNLLFVAQAFSDGKLLKCLLLPRQNFVAPELVGLFEVCRNRNNEGQFLELLQTRLKAVRQRSVPKKGKSGNHYFLKDDNDRYFKLGKEHHGQSETAKPPHNSDCHLTASARFGVTVDRYLHFNVSTKSGRISGTFEDCHATQVQVSPCSHINMFPNGFIR